MSLSHLLILGIIAVIVIPPEKLPEVARQIARFLGEMRRMTSGVFDDLREDVVLTPDDMLKKKQQKEKEQAEATTPTATVQATSSEATEEQKQKIQEEYLKHIQPEPVTAKTEEKKTENE